MKNVFEIRAKNTMTHRELKQALNVLQAGGVIIYPTDTLYGAGVDATNKKAVRKLFILKGRVKTKAVSVMLPNRREIEKYCKLTRAEKNIIRKHLPGPFTFLCRSKKNAAGLNKKLIDKTRRRIGIRVPNSPLARQVARAFKKPITATSANKSGLPAPASTAEVKKYLLKNNPGAKNTLILIVNAGRLFGIPSTVVDLTTKKPKIVRSGAGVFQEK